MLRLAKFMLTTFFCVCGLTTFALAQENPLEAALNMKTGTKDKFDDFQDAGGLNKYSTLYGLNILGIDGVSYNPSGGAKEVNITVPNSYSAANLRKILEKLCNVDASSWELKRGDFQSGKAKGRTCEVLYLPNNSQSWAVSWALSGIY